MSRIFNGTTAKLYNDENSGITSYDATIFFWAKFTSLGNWEVLARLYNTTNDYIGMGLNSSNDMKSTSNQDISATATDATNISLDTWLPYVAVHTAAGVTLYSQGSSYNTPETLSWVTNVSGEDELIIGTEASDTFWFNGKMSHLTVWDVELSAGDITALISGADPWAIDNSNITRYWAFTDTSLTDAKNSSVLSNTDTTTDGDNPILTATYEQTGDVNAIIAADSTIVYEATGGGGSSIPVLASSIYSRMRQG